MNKSILLAATAVLALTAGSAMAASHPGLVGAKPANLHVPPHTASTLYSQNSNFGSGIDSQNFTSGSFGTGYNDAAADDFVVPASIKWHVATVDVTGLYFNGSGPASSEIVTFYKHKHGHPGAIAGRGADTIVLNCADSAGSFSCTLPAPVKLSGGLSGKTYWVSVVANCSFVGGCGEWGWVQNTVTHNNPGEWENPGNNFATGCTTWGNPTSSCIPGVADDYAFDLQS